jgi:hypothetical protein
MSIVNQPPVVVHYSQMRLMNSAHGMDTHGLRAVKSVGR